MPNKFIPVCMLLLAPIFGVAQSLQTVIQKGHELAVVAVAVSPDSNFVATGSKDKSVKLWDIETGREIRSLLGHESAVSSVKFSPDGNFLISGSHDKTARIWDILTGKEVFVLETHDIIVDVAFDPKKRFIVVAGYNRSGVQDSATLYDYKTREKIKRLPLNADEGRGFGISLAISNDGKYLAFGEDNRLVNVYKTKDWSKTFTFQYEEGWCGGCATMTAFSPDSESLYMASHNGPLKKYDLNDGKLIRVYEQKSQDLSGLAVSTDGKLIARSTEKDVVVFDEETGKMVSTFFATSSGGFNKIEFALDNRLVVTSDDNTAFFWNLQKHKKELLLTGFLNTRDQGGLNYDPNFHWESAIAKYVRFKNTLLISRDGKSLIKGKFGTKVKQWDIATGKGIMEFTGHKKAVLCYDLSKDGTRLVTGGGDGKIILWDAKTGDSLKTIASYFEPIFDIHFNSDESKVATSCWDASMKIHDLKTGKLETYVEFESYAAYNIVFHPNDLYLVAARLDNSLQLWEIDTRSVVKSFVGHTDIVSSLQISNDQKTLMSASWDGSVRLWDIGTGLMIKKFKEHRGAVFTSVFSPDGKNIYSAGADRSIKVWDQNTGKVIRTFEGHNAEITALLFSPDSKMLISHSVDGVTKFWDLGTGKEFFEHIHFGEGDWMAKNPDGYFNGTDKARKHIHFVSGLRTYSVDQFFNDFYRPDLLPKIFQNRGESPELKGVQGKLNSTPPPTIKVGIIPSGNGKADLLVKIIDNGNGAENLKIFHNGKNIAVPPDVTMPSGKGQSSTFKHVVDLVGGQNSFSVTAQNRDRIESDAQAAELFSDYASKSSTCYVLAVGINQYKNPRMSLNYAKPDADSFSKLMDEKGSDLFKSIELHTLYDEDASREKILAKLDELTKKINSEDVFIFYYAGHGSMVDNKFYFIPTETLRLYDATALNREGIEASIIQEKFKHIKALKQLIIMDACQSGGSVELLANRGAAEEKAIAQLSRSAGIHIMASAGSEQFAAEFTELGHGLFTYVLMRGLQGDADGAPKDGKVTIYELKSFIDDQVPEMTRKLKGKPQYPYTFSRGQDFPVAIE